VDSVVKKVQSLLNKYGTSCPFEIAKLLGIQIVFEELGNTLGYYSSHFRIKVIHINQNATDSQRKFICAHELGHAICHPEFNTSFLKKHTLFSTDHIEIEANTFAVTLLFSHESEESISIDTAVNEYGIPEKMIKKFLPFK